MAKNGVIHGVEVDRLRMISLVVVQRLYQVERRNVRISSSSLLHDEVDIAIH